MIYLLCVLAYGDEIVYQEIENISVFENNYFSDRLLSLFWTQKNLCVFIHSFLF